MTREAELRRLLDEGTAGPWTQSAFIDKYPHMPEDWKAESRNRESTLLRGGPRANPVVFCQANEDRALIVAAVNALPALLDEREVLRRLADRWESSASAVMDRALEGDPAAAMASASSLRSRAAELREALDKWERS